VIHRKSVAVAAERRRMKRLWVCDAITLAVAAALIAAAAKRMNSFELN